MIRRLAALLPLLLATTIAAAAERRCGWFVNQNPPDASLLDRDGEWELMRMGWSYPPGMDSLPDMRSGGWVVTHDPGGYGHGCACLTMDVDRDTRRVTRILRAEPQPLRRCQEDPSLPQP